MRRWKRLLPAAMLALAAAMPAAAVNTAHADPAPSMTAEQIAGQHVIYSYPGLTPPPDLLARIRAGEVAGVIFFAENIANPQQLAAVSAQLRDAAMASPIKLPLLLMSDQEGGQVRRLPGGPAASERDIGASADPGAVAAGAGTVAAQTLRASGLNLNLAPVLGVHRAPGDFLDSYGRSYSGDPRIVATAGSRFIAAQQQGGAAATAKHFPGLGAAPTNANTDEVPVTIGTSAAEIRDVDEAPYRAAIAQGTKLVMPSWAVYPALDSLPAGLSPKIIQGELRGRLGYQGVTITDAIGAGALSGFGDVGRHGVLATQAGMDLLLGSARSIPEAAQVGDALAQAITSGAIDPIQLATSTARVLALRSSLGR